MQYERMYDSESLLVSSTEALDAELAAPHLMRLSLVRCVQLCLGVANYLPLICEAWKEGAITGKAETVGVDVLLCARGALCIAVTLEEIERFLRYAALHCWLPAKERVQMCRYLRWVAAGGARERAQRRSAPVLMVPAPAWHSPRASAPLSRAVYMQTIDLENEAVDEYEWDEETHERHWPSERVENRWRCS